jgi:serine/threonine protein kinase
MCVMLKLKLLEVIDTKNALYLVQELAAKGSLAENIPQKGMNESRCLSIMTGIVSGVAFLHKNDIVHR